MRHSFNVFRRVSLVAAAILFVLFIAWHNDDFREISTTTVLGAVVVAFHCALIGVGLGAAAAVSQMAWKRWGARALWPPAGALCGGLLFGGGGLIAWQVFGPSLQSGGVHGGGDVAAMLVLGGTAVLAIVGALLGGLLGVLIAAISKRRS